MTLSVTLVEHSLGNPKARISEMGHSTEWALEVQPDQMEYLITSLKDIHELMKQAALIMDMESASKDVISEPPTDTGTSTDQPA